VSSPASSSKAQKPAAICLLGPTAIGKTQLALELADRLPVSLINVDSAQIYRGMDIGTGKPDAATLAQYPHQLMDIIDPSQAYSAADFRDDAIRVMQIAVDAGKTPLLVGGTMLYFKVLRDGLADMPNADPEIRREIEELAANLGWEGVHAELARVDPQSAARIHHNDPQRLQRALEVYRLTGKSLSAHHASGSAKTAADLPCSLHFMAIQAADRTVLHERIAARFRRMLARGLVEEVQGLHDREELNLQLPSIKSVGYRQIWQYLDGELDYDAMIEKSIIATRQLAKRQTTWLRSWPNLQQLGAPTAKSIDNVLNYLESVSI
jgi:tRNA dimethylallyltransferase